MSANLPTGFYAQVLSYAFPENHTYKVALFEDHQDIATYTSSGECDDYGYEQGGQALTGHKVNDFGTYATLSFNTTVDWFDVTVKTRCAVIYDADTGVVLNIMNFEKPTGVIGGLYTVTLHKDGVVQLGVKPE